MSDHYIFEHLGRHIYFQAFKPSYTFLWVGSRSLKSTTTQPAVGGPKTFWEDQRAWRPKNLAAQWAEGTKVLRRQTTGGTINIHQTDRGQKITHLCRWLNLSKFTRFLGGPNGPKICGGRTKTDFKDRDHTHGIQMTMIQQQLTVL